jgi:hypothetical protein
MIVLTVVVVVLFVAGGFSVSSYYDARNSCINHDGLPEPTGWFGMGIQCVDYHGTVIKAVQQ